MYTNRFGNCPCLFPSFKDIVQPLMYTLFESSCFVFESKIVHTSLVFCSFASVFCEKSVKLVAYKSGLEVVCQELC